MISCKNCTRTFSIDAQDKKFYEKMNVPEPVKCPPCRQQQRLAFRNEYNFHRRKSDFSGQDMLTTYAPDCPYLVYDQEEWWSDKWDPMKYGREFDFSRPFFEQFQEMRLLVPRVSLNAIGNENSYYTNYALKNKNSYLVTTAAFVTRLLMFIDHNRVFLVKNLMAVLIIIFAMICATATTAFFPPTSAASRT